MLIWLVFLQVTAQSVFVTPPDPSLATFDLATAKPADPDDRCGVDQPDGDIVICARKKVMDIDTSRMADFTAKPVRAGVDLPGGGRAAVTVQQVDIGGTPSRRVMVGAKLPF